MTLKAPVKIRMKIKKIMMINTTPIITTAINAAGAAVFSIKTT
jgi:hypothetical protein